MPRRTLLIALLLVLPGCGSEGPAGPPRVGDPLPAFSAALLGGEEAAFADYRGAPVLVNLWATWCAPCRAEMPYLESIGRRYAPEGLQVVGVSTDHSGAFAEVRKVVAERGVTYDVLLDTEARSTDLFGAFGLPVTFLADAEGVISWMRLGPIEEGDADFETALEALMKGDES